MSLDELNSIYNKYQLICLNENEAFNLVNKVRVFFLENE